MQYLVLAFFFVSGACGLIYEVVWSREFVVTAGGTTHAVTAVVSAFMAGLGIGSIIGGRYIDRTDKNPFIIYGLLEGGVALTAVLVPYLATGVQPVLGVLYKSLGGQSPLYDILRFLLSALVLFPPTLLMGASLPVLMRATLTDRKSFGFTAGRLYAINTIGAMAGAGLAGFVLLPAFGNRLSNYLAVALNLVIFVSIIALRNRLSFRPVGEVQPADWSDRRWTLTALIVTVGYGLSGLASLIYQISWTRYLVLTLGGSTYSFSLILVAFIGGLGIGGAIMTPFADRIKRPLFFAGIMEFAICVSAVLVLPVMENINVYMYEWIGQLRGDEDNIMLLYFGVAFGVLIVPTVVMGALLPLLVRIMARERPGAGEPMGWVYFANTIGSVGGAFLAGYVLLDMFGVETTVLIATWTSLAIGVVWVLAGEMGRRTSVLVAFLLALSGGALITRVPKADPLVTNSGPYIYARVSFADLSVEKDLREELHKQYKVVYYGEDAETSVLVTDNLYTGVKSLRINGKVDASDGIDMTNQVLLAQLPMLLHPGPRTVMVLGLASGVTGGSALLHPVDRVDCLELSPSVAKASKAFSDVNNLDMDDPRYNLILTDGRNHLALSGRKYDVIISEPSNPWQAGQGMMFTKGYFELMRDNLNDGGIALAWLDLYSLDRETFALVLRTFADVFEHVTLWETSYQADFVMLGSSSPMMIDYGSLKKKTERPAIKEDLERVGVNAVSLLERFVMDRDAILKAVGKGPLHTDDMRQLEFQLPRVAFTPYSERVEGIIGGVLSRHVPASRIVGFGDGDGEKEVSERLIEIDRLKDDVLGLELKVQAGMDPEERYDQTMRLLDRLDGSFPSGRIAREAAKSMLEHAKTRNRERQREAAEKFARYAIDLDQQYGNAYLFLANLMYAKRDLEGATLLAQKALELDFPEHRVYVLLARVARARGEKQEEANYWRKALYEYPDNLTYLLSLARVLSEMGQPQAIPILEQIIDEHPENSDAHFFLGLDLSRRGLNQEAARHFGTALELDPDHPSAKLMRNMLENSKR